MPVKPPSDAALQQTVDRVAELGSIELVAKEFNLARTTLTSQLHQAERKGIKPSIGRKEHLESRLKRLEVELVDAQKKALSESEIRRRIVGLQQDVAATQPPRWLIDTTEADSAPGVPTLFLSDLHWGEVVHPSQINGVNRFNLEIAHRRMDILGERAVRLLSILDNRMRYPGIVICLGGDMISGNIHEELSQTNEINTMPTVVDLYGKLVQFIGAMADKFGRVFVPCVTGNHGRDTKKIQSKDRHHTSFDWLLYVFLAKHFEKDKRITFLVPDGPDAYWKVFGHRYLMTHGDQFRGGDGMIGALGPIIRGDHRKRSRNAQIDMAYDTMLLGHWHQYIHLARLIVNGSLKGYDEYAYSNNFGFEPPQQALWITHPKYGITYRMPVYVEKVKSAPKTAWVSVAA